jgi:seryl-tRNA synthetase
MLDIKLLRTEPERVKQAMQSRGVGIDSDAILAADETYRAALAELEEARALQNAGSKGPVSPDRIKALKALKGRIKEMEARVASAEDAFQTALAQLPNIPLEDTPVGADATGNVIVSQFGNKQEFGFTPKHYLDIAEKLGIVDTETAGTVAGTRFGYLKGSAAMLEFALLQYALSKVTDETFIADLIHKHSLPLVAKPLVPVIPPVMVRPEMMKAMGFAERAGVERGNDEIYFLERDGLYLVGTAEQSVGPMHYDRILASDDMPLRYVAFSTCFRRESGAAGKDTRGILRVHQFDKLEMFTVCTPEQSMQEHRLLLACQEALMQGLELHYQVVRLCTGDIGQASAATFDIETWMPGQNEYRETHSTSNTTDYQSRALKTRFRMGEGATEYAHMLNGTACAMPRMIIAILEQFQNEDGSVRVPEVLRPFMGGLDAIR